MEEALGSAVEPRQGRVHDPIGSPLRVARGASRLLRRPPIVVVVEAPIQAVLTVEDDGPTTAAVAKPASRKDSVSVGISSGRRKTPLCRTPCRGGSRRERAGGRVMGAGEMAVWNRTPRAASPSIAGVQARSAP